MSDAVTPIAPVRTTVTVPVSPSRAFELFTQEMGSWWPLVSHSVGLERSERVTFGPGVGDPITEWLENGSREVWGTVIALDPPVRIAFNWHAGRSSDATTLVEVSFTPDADGSTLVELVHSGWERWVDGATQSVGYRDGWPPVLAAYVEKASADQV